MRIAIPISGGAVAEHFGHCEAFVFVDVDAGRKCVVQTSQVAAPEHQPGLLPGWLGERGVNAVIASGMGSRALRLFEECGIRVLAAAPEREPLALARDFLEGTLVDAPSACGHSHHGHALNDGAGPHCH